MGRAWPLLAGLLLAGGGGGCGGCGDAPGRGAPDAGGGPEPAADVIVTPSPETGPDAAPRDARERTEDVPATQDASADRADGPPIPETPPEFQALIDARMGPCEQYIQPIKEDLPRQPSGLDAYHLGGVDAERVVFSSGHQPNLWAVSLASREWRWLGSCWPRVAYARGMVLAVESSAGQARRNASSRRVRLWHLGEGWLRDLEPQFDEYLDHLAIGDGFIAYADYRRIPDYGISRYPTILDLASGESSVLSELGHEIRMDAAGQLVAWVDYRDYPDPERVGEVYLYDHTQGEVRQLTEDQDWQFNPRTDGRSVVWEDARNGTYTPPDTTTNCDVYLFHVPDGTYHQVTNEPHNQERPDVDGDYVVYQDDRAGAPPQNEELTTRLNLDVYLTNWRTGREFQMTYDHHQQYEPRLTGRKLAFKERRLGGGTGYPGLTVLDLDCYERHYGVDLDAP